MEGKINFCVGSLVRICRGEERLLVRVEKTAARKSLGRVDQVRPDRDDHGFNQGDVITFLNTDVIEVLELGRLEHFLTLAVEAFRHDWELTLQRSGKSGRGR
jgi:hypothetical protein